MAGLFEVFVDAESHFRFRLKAPDGTVTAVSKAFDDKAATVAEIAPHVSAPVRADNGSVRGLAEGS